MKIKIEFTSHLQLIGITNHSFVEMDGPKTISQFLTECKINPEHLKYIITTVNKSQVDLSYILQNNDELLLYLPVGGG